METMKTLFELTAEFVGEHGHLYPKAAFACQPRTVLELVMMKLSAADLYRLDDILCCQGLDVDVVWHHHCQTLNLLRRGVKDVFGESDGITCYKDIYHYKQFHSLLTILSLDTFAAGMCDVPSPTDMYTVPLHKLKQGQGSRQADEVHPSIYKSFLMKCAKYCKKLVLNGRHVHYIASDEELMMELIKHTEKLVISPLTTFCFYNLKYFLTQLLTEGHLEQISLRGSSLSEKELTQLLAICSGCPCHGEETAMFSGGKEVVKSVSTTMSTLLLKKSFTTAPETTKQSSSNESSPGSSDTSLKDQLNQLYHRDLQDKVLDCLLDQAVPSSSNSQTQAMSSSDTSSETSAIGSTTPPRCLSPQAKPYSIPTSPLASDKSKSILSRNTLSKSSSNHQSLSATAVSRPKVHRRVSDCLAASSSASECSAASSDLIHRSRSCEKLCVGSGGVPIFAMTSDTGTLTAGDIISQYLPHWSNLRKLYVFLSAGLMKTVLELVRRKQLTHLVVDTGFTDMFLECLIHLFMCHYRHSEYVRSKPMEFFQISGCKLICIQEPVTIKHKLAAVKVLDLSWNSFEEQTFNLLLEFIRADTALRGLRLASCHLQPDKIRQILDTLIVKQRNTGPGMEELSLNDNMVEGEGCEQSLTNFVLHSTSLKKLCLSNVGLSNTIDFCPSFVDAVGDHQGLEILDISNNYLGARHLQVLEKILALSPVMRDLNAAFNQFKGQDLIEMLDRLERSRSKLKHKMDHLSLSRNAFTADEQMCIVNRFSVYAHEVRANCIGMHADPLEHVAQM
ncbi:uncharacterized protein [Haliotis cracherodii]|uniref:uncharacterized protein n=1 Tax=Haliotis cracherodii TaxID=6455 RepID=UPI0039E9C9BB